MSHMGEIMGLNAYGADITLMEYLEGQEYNTLHELNEMENIDRDANQNIIPFNDYIIQNPTNIDGRIIPEYINPEYIEEDEIVEEDLAEENLLDIPVRHWDPDSYFIDFLKRHYAALAIQNRWRSYMLYQ